MDYEFVHGDRILPHGADEEAKDGYEGNSMGNCIKVNLQQLSNCLLLWPASRLR